MADISDGTSCTYLAGEKYINADDYMTGMCLDDQGWATGFDTCVLRFTNLDPRQYSAAQVTSFAILNDETNIDAPSSVYRTYCAPRQDQSGVDVQFCFGSAHSGSFNMAFCDGSVSSISYSIAPAIHLRLGSRNDGKTISSNAY